MQVITLRKPSSLVEKLGVCFGKYKYPCDWKNTQYFLKHHQCSTAHNVSRDLPSTPGPLSSGILGELRFLSTLYQLSEQPVLQKIKTKTHSTKFVYTY